MRTELSLSGIAKTYGEVTALHPTDLSIKTGEFLTFLGPSGSGKTTLLMTIAGFVMPSAGQMLLDGKDITRIPPEARNFGVVFQGYALFPHLSVWDNVWFPLRARNMGRKQSADAVAEALELMELSRYARRLPQELSGGQQQRVALARALVFKPDLLLLDEPLSALDKTLRKTLQTELKALHRKVGTTFVYVTHDQEEALSMSDRIAILKDGRIQQIAPPAQLYNQPTSPFVAGFLGRSNFLEAEVLGGDGAAIRLRAPFGDLTGRADMPCLPGTKMCVAIRPERISLCTTPADGSRGVRGTIREVTFLGSQLDIEVEVSGAVLEASLPVGHLGATDTLLPGTEVWLDWPEEAALVLPLGAPS